MRLTTTGWRESYIGPVMALILTLITITFVFWGIWALTDTAKEYKEDERIAKFSREIDEGIKLNQAMEWAAQYLCDADIADLEGFSYNEYGLTDVKCTERGSRIIK